MAVFYKMISSILMKTQLATVPRRFCQMMPDALDHSTGKEKRERLAIAAGNPNPFDEYLMKRCEGTRENPNCVPSAFDKRLIGCICHEDAQHFCYMWLHSDHMKRCQCGYWFKLYYKAPV